MSSQRDPEVDQQMKLLEQRKDLVHVEGTESSKYSENGPAEEVLDKNPSLFTWLQLVFIVILNITNQWQRFALSYAYGIGNSKNDPETEIKTFYPDLSNYYGLLAGASFTISFSIFGIFGGIISDHANRKMIVACACILWSSMTVLMGAIDSFALLFVFRLGLGVFESIFNPSAYSIIADLFHPEKRGTANSVFNLGIYFGGALSSLSTLMFLGIGWRTSFMIIGGIGVVFGFVTLLVVQEPRRNRWEIKSQNQPQKKKQEGSGIRRILSGFSGAAAEIFVNPTCRWTVIAGSFRFFGGYAIGFFMPAFFGGMYPENKKMYAGLNAGIVSLCGFTSSLCGGIVSDKYEKQGNLMTKAYVCIFAGIMGIPFIALCTTIQSSFWLSISMLGFEYLFAECWFGPAITMVLNTISPANKGFAVSAFLFCTTIAGTISTALLGYLENVYDAKVNPSAYGYILCVFICFSYGGSIPFFYLAGRSYEKFKLQEAKNKEQNDY